MDDYESLIIEVTGINDNTSKDTLDNYFSSSKRGGDIANIEYIQGSGKASITFANAEGARKVLETRPHTLEGSALTTRQKKVEYSENDKVFVEGISSKTSKDCLQFYMELISSLEVKNITYGKRSSESVNAIVTFHSQIDFDKLQEGFKKKPTLEEKHISIQTVPVCKTILVKNLPPTATYDSVFYKFESKKTGGGEVKDGGVHLDLEKRIALVEFEDPNVIDKVLSLEQTLDNSTLSVQRYHPILGSLADLQSTETELTKPEPRKPETSEPARRVPPVPKPRHRKTTILTADIDLDLYHYLKDYHPAQWSLAFKDPQPNIKLKEESATFTFSTQDAKDHFLNEIKEYKSEIVPVNPSLLKQGLSEKINEIILVFSSGKSVSFIERYNEGFIKLVGRSVSTFDLAINKVKECIAEIEEKTNRRDDVIQILPVQLKLLQRLPSFQRLAISLKQDGCEIQLDDTKGKITVKGSQAQIQKLKNETQDIVGRFDERSLNQSKFSLLKTPKGLSHVITLLPTTNLMVEINDRRNVMLHGTDQSEVQRAYDTMEKAIVEIELPPILKTKESQDALLKVLGTSIPFVFERERGQPRVICFKEHLRNLNGKIDDFLERRKPIDKRIPLSKVILRYLSLHGEKLFDSLRLSSPGLKIEIGNDAVVVSGERPLVDNCCTSIEQFTRGLKCDSMDYGTPETAAGIKEKGANAIIQTIERKHQCGIVVVTKEETDVRRSFRTSTTSPVHNLNENRERTMQCRYKYPNGKIIEIHQGDILNHAVYYLVNAANDQMKHSGGLARAIVEKGGRKIQTDCARALQDLGKDRLIPGNVITTDSGGGLMCKKILHVVVPKHRDTPDGDEAREEMYLRYCCNNVLKDATNGQTIAIPVLGTGIYNIPHDISAKSLVCAAHEFLQEHPTHPLKEVHFVDNNPPAIEALMKEMTTRFAHDPNFHINELVRDRWRHYVGAASVAPSSAPATPSGDMAFNTLEGMEIRLTVGNIAKSTTNVIVNTVSNDLNLTKNPCSKAILHEAGDKIATFCEKWIKDNNGDQLQEGNFAITDGAKLKCNKVFHVSCPSWTADQGEKNLRQLVQKILNKVQSLSLASISIPAIGTGTLNFPTELVAKVLFEEAMQFSAKQKSSLKIKKYNIVVYNKNAKAVDIFKQQFQVYSSKKIENIPTAKRTKPRIFSSLKSSTKEKEKDKAKEKDSEDETHGVIVDIVQGNIVEATTDAIGFLVSEDIKQGGQIGTALLKAAGQSLEQEYSKLGKIEAGSVVMTGAGNLKTRCLLHMVFKTTALKTDKSIIQDTVTKCLNHADSCGFTSLSLPAVGTGHLKKDAKQSAEILYSCIKEYRKRNDKSLKLIRIVILQESVYADFNKAFVRKDPTTSAEGTLRIKQQITLEIAAETLNDIAKIKEELRQVEAEQSHSENIEVKKQLDDVQHDEILEVQDLHNVRIECEPAIGFIRISGLAKNVSNAVGEIHRIIYAWEQEKHNTDATVREVQWFYYEADASYVIPEKYADSLSAKIERAYKDNPSGSIVLGNEIKFEVDFKTMTEKCLEAGENKIMQVYRRPCDAYPQPRNWEYQPIDSSTGKELVVHRFVINKTDNSNEYDDIHDMFMASVTPVLPNTQVVRIERIQNPRLYQIYEGQKKKMINDGNEMMLFHGTAKGSLEAINTSGFNRAYCGKNAVRFGKGSYFATQAWYSARKNYSTPDENGLQYMYIARVLVGKYTKGKEGLLVPPPIDESNQTARYDSVVDDATKPTMFVIFYDYQSYPEYLITFKT